MRPSRIIGGLDRFAADARGIAAVEFALILPLLITLYFGTVEASRLYTVDRKVASVAATMADLVARAKQSISEANAIDKYFAAAEAIMTPYQSDVLTQTVSLLQIDDEEAREIKRWAIRALVDAARR